MWQATPARSLVAFAVARGVQDLYLSVPRTIDDDHEHRRWLLDVAREAQGWGLTLHALGGDPSWWRRPAEAISWQGSAHALGVFVRTHVDAECWRDPAWAHDPAAVIGGFLSLLEQLGDQGRVDCDIPWWFHRHSTASGEPMDVAVLRRVERATAMTYRRVVSGDNGLLDIARPVLAAAAYVGSSVQLAVDTTPPAPGEEHTSFHGCPASELVHALEAVDTALRAVAPYAGIAVHDLQGWRRLTP